MGSLFEQGDIRAPSLGAVGFDENGPIGVDSWTTACHDPDAPDPQATMPGGWRWLMQVGPCEFMWGQHEMRWVPFHAGHLGPPSTAPDVPGVGDGPVVPTLRPGEQPLSETAAIERLMSELTDHAEEYAALIPWLEHELGQAPTATPDGTPFCGGMNYEACVSAYQHAGFTGPFTKKVLDPEDAWLGEPAGAVITATPRADALPDERGEEVVIEVNPAAVPAMTAEDEQVAQELETRNPQDENKNLTTRVRRNLARQCRKYVQKALKPLSWCWDLPIMITGGADAMGPARNDVLALKRRWRWIGLNNRLSEPNQSAPDRPRPPWYRNRAEPEPGCVLVDGNAPASMGCDEYPMWGMSQGHTGDLETDVPNLMWTNSRENGRQGNVYKQFVSRKGIDKMLFGGCRVPEEEPWPGLSNAAKDAVPPTFLAVPMPFDEVPSFGICNGPRP
jgi:hypothetical protein